MTKVQTLSLAPSIEFWKQLWNDIGLKETDGISRKNLLEKLESRYEVKPKRLLDLGEFHNNIKHNLKRSQYFLILKDKQISQLDTPSKTEVRAYYKTDDVKTFLKSYGSFGDFHSLCNNDFIGWYKDEKNSSAVGGEYPHRYRCYSMGEENDYSEVASQVERTIYTTINYQHRDEILSMEAFGYRENEDGWYREPYNEKPTPEYSDIYAMSFLADIDLESEYKKRPLGEGRRGLVSKILEKYIDGFGELFGSRDPVFCLDSVGGAYILSAPLAITPITQSFDGDNLDLILEEICSRVNDWLDGVRQQVNSQHPMAEQFFETDLLNNKNRLYKAPLSLHSDIDGFVHPLQVDDGAVKYEFLEADVSSSSHVDDVWSWLNEFKSERFMDEVYVENLIDELWLDEDGDWMSVLENWVRKEKQQLKETHTFDQDVATDKNNVKIEADVLDIDDVTLTDHPEKVTTAAINTDIKNVVKSYASDDFDTANRPKETNFDPIWRRSDSGKSCYITQGSNIFGDNECNGGGGPVFAFALGVSARSGKWRGVNLVNTGKKASSESIEGKEWREAIRLMRFEGYDIPLYVPEAGSPIYQKKTDVSEEVKRESGCDDNHLYIETGEYDCTPAWALHEVSDVLGICDRNQFDFDDGAKCGFPCNEIYDSCIKALEYMGVDTGRETIT